MKELDTYKAEILRRSERKLRKRRNRRIALGAGLSLCLCLFATAAFLGLPMGAAKSDCVAEMAPDCAGSLSQVLVQEENLSVTDPQTVAALRLLLMDCSEDSNDLEYGSVNSAPSASDALKDQSYPNSRIITLIWEGETERFRLTGRQLLREATGDSRILTAEEVKQLEALLEKGGT